MSQNAFLPAIDARIAAQHLLTHDFYKAWSKGKLSREILRDYAEQYYHHVEAFPTYISKLHAHVQDPEIRTELTKNLYEEEGTVPTHPDLWLDFAESLGASREVVRTSKPRAAVQNLINTFSEICEDGDVAEGLCALYSYESQIPEVAKAKVDGLKEFYGMTDTKSYKYFTVHQEADVEHSNAERRMLAKVLTHQNADKVEQASGKVLQALWDMLSELCERHNISCAVH